MREYILSGNLLLRSSPLISSILGGRVGRGAILCIPTRPNEVGACPVLYPYSIAAATGLRSKRKFVHPLTRIEAIVIFDIPRSRNGCFAAVKKEEEKKEKRKSKRRKGCGLVCRPVIEFHNLSASLS